MCQPPEEHGHRDNPLHFDRRGQVPTFPESERRPFRVIGSCGTLPKPSNPDSRPPPYYPNPMPGAWDAGIRGSPAKPPRQGNINPDQAFNTPPIQRLKEAGTWGGSPTPSIANANPAIDQHTYTNIPDSVDGNGNSSRTISLIDLDPWEPFQPDLQPPLLPQPPQQPLLPPPLQPQPAFRPKSLITCEWLLQ